MEIKRSISSLDAWLITGLLTALLAVFVLVFYAPFLGFQGDFGNEDLFFISIYEGVYLVSHVIVGLPFFLYFWPRPSSFVWRIYFSLPVGFVLGYLAMFSLFYIYSGFDLSSVDKSFLTGFRFGGYYGLVTALIAWITSKRASRTTESSSAPDAMSRENLR